MLAFFTIFTLLAIALIAGGAVCSPVLAFWAFYCLAHSGRRTEGLLILAVGALAAAGMVALLLLTAHPHGPAINWSQGLIIVPCFYGIAADAAKGLHQVTSRCRSSSP